MLANGTSSAVWLLAPIAFLLAALGALLLWRRSSRAYAQALRTRQTAEEQGAALRLEEVRFRTLCEAIPEITWIADANARMEYFNHRSLEYAGWTAEDAKHKTWRDALEPSDLPEALSRWRECQKEGAPYEMQFRLRRADGEYRWFLSRALPMRNAEGRIVRWFGTSTDIHEQKRAEERSRFLATASEVLSRSLDQEVTLSTLTRMALDGFADWAAVDALHADGTIERVALAHRDPAKVKLAWELARVYPARLSDPTSPARALRTGAPELAAEITEEQLLRSFPDPEQLRIFRELALVSSIVVPLHVRGRIWGALTFAMAESSRRYRSIDLELAKDLGHRAELALDNAALLRESREAGRIKDEFLSTLSHELRTPLTSVLGWANILRNCSPSPEKLARGLATIERNARAQARMVEDLLDVSRIVNGKLRLNVREVSLPTVVEAVLDTVSPAAEAKEIHVHTLLATDAALVAGDADRLQQIVWNLLSNSIKFTPPGGEVTVQVARDGAQTRLSVSDTGQGITPEFLPFVFDRLRQADASSSRQHGGLGLGLTIVRHLIELHGGSVEAQSNGRGQGACFTVRLPISTRRGTGFTPRSVTPIP